MDKTGADLKRLEELASMETFPDALEEVRTHKEIAAILAALPWEKWAQREDDLINNFMFFLLLEPDKIEKSSGARVFRNAAIEAARVNPAAARLVMDFPSHWPFVELDDIRKWITARPPAVDVAFAERLSPHNARDIVPPPDVGAQLELLEELVTYYDGARAAAAISLRQWITVRAEAGERAADALGRTVSAIADMLRDEEHEERDKYLVEMAIAPALEEKAVRDHVLTWVDDSARVRAALVILLSLFDLDDAGPALKRLADDEVPNLRDEALRSLVKIGEEERFTEDERAAALEIIEIARQNNAPRKLLEPARKVFSSTT